MTIIFQFFEFSIIFYFEIFVMNNCIISTSVISSANKYLPSKSVISTGKSIIISDNAVIILIFNIYNVK